MWRGCRRGRRRGRGAGERGGGGRQRTEGGRGGAWWPPTGRLCLQALCPNTLTYTYPNPSQPVPFKICSRMRIWHLPPHAGLGPSIGTPDHSFLWRVPASWASSPSHGGVVSQVGPHLPATPTYGYPWQAWGSWVPRVHVSELWTHQPPSLHLEGPGKAKLSMALPPRPHGTPRRSFQPRTSLDTRVRMFRDLPCENLPTGQPPGHSVCPPPLQLNLNT